jgi:heparosan-N-sulfate-glucuronate 5-epimerase
MKKKLFMLKKLIRDLKSTVPDLNMEVNQSSLDYYYFKFKLNLKKLNRLIIDFDQDGIPLNRPYIDVENVNSNYYPITIGQYGLAVYHSWLEKKETKHKAQFLNIADWFTTQCIIDERLGGYWLTEVPKPEFKVFDPWKSAFSQSRGISILLRAYQLTGDISYFLRAEKALTPFTFSTLNGGVAVDLDEEMAFYEEYVAEKPTRVLDGAFFSLFGVYDFIRVTNELPDYRESNQLAQEIFRKGINGLKFWLPKFDMGYWVYYNRCEIDGYPQNDPCTIGYLRLVTAQLIIIHQITGDDFFREMGMKFEGYLKPLNILKMYKEKFKALKKLNRL